MELRVFDDEFLNQQLKEIDKRTKDLLKIDTSNGVAQTRVNNKSMGKQVASMPELAKMQTSQNNMTVNMRALTHSTQNILKNVLKNAQSTVNIRDGDPETLH